MTIRLNGQTSGYVELEAPAAAGSNTLTLPTSNGSNGQFLQTNGSGVLAWAAAAGAGRILQILSTTNNTQSDTTSTSYTSTGFGLTITPSATSSKIIILCNASATPSTSAASGIYQVVMRGSTKVTNEVITYNDSTASDTWRSTFMFGIDSPNTTSATQYLLHFKSHNGTSVYSNWGASAPQQIYLLELGQ